MRAPIRVLSDWGQAEGGGSQTARRDPLQSWGSAESGRRKCWRGWEGCPAYGTSGIQGGGLEPGESGHLAPAGLRGSPCDAWGLGTAGTTVAIWALTRPRSPATAPGPSASAAPAPPACWSEPAGQHYFSSLAAAACPPASPSEAGGASSSSASSSSAASAPAAPRPAEGPLSARSRSNSAERLLEAAGGGADEPPEAAAGEGARGRTRAVENQYSFY